MILKGASQLTHNMKQFYRPDDFVANTIHPNSMRIVSLDEGGPFYLLNNQGEYDKTYILVCVELLTYKCHLIPLPRLDTLHFIRALEILQSLRGQMTTIILDDASFHNPLRQSEDESQDEFKRSALQGLLDKGHYPELHKSGIDIVIASSKRHERVGRAEHIIKKIKFLLVSALKTWIFHDTFDFMHKVSLINHYLNKKAIIPHRPRNLYPANIGTIASIKIQ